MGTVAPDPAFVIEMPPDRHGNDSQLFLGIVASLGIRFGVVNTHRTTNSHIPSLGGVTQP